MTEHEQQHGPSITTYAVILGALLVLTVATTAIAYVDLGPGNPIMAIFIAWCKMMLVVLFFMHVRYSSRLTMLFVGAGFIWLILLLAGTMQDVLTRGWTVTR